LNVEGSGVSEIAQKTGGRGVRLTKSDGTGPVSVGLLDSSSGRRSLLGGLGGELLSGTEQGRRKQCQ